MTNALKVQNFYYTNITSESIPSSGAFTFNVAVAPTYTNGFLVISAENVQQREIVYFHSVSGNTISVRAENRGIGGTTAKEHVQGESITMRDVAEIFNFYADTVSTCFYTEKIGGLGVKVWGGLVYYNTVLTTVADTTLTLVDNTTNYIKYSYTTNVVSSDTVNVGNIKVAVTTLSGAIVSIVYQPAKETYTDFTVSLNTALPSQPGNSGKFLQTDGTNATWQFPASTPDASTTVKGVVEVATLAQSTAGTNIGETGAPLVSTPGDIKALYAEVGHTHAAYTLVKNGTMTISTVSAGPSAAVDNSSASTGLIAVQTIARFITAHGSASSTGYLMISTDNSSFSPLYTSLAASGNVDFTFVLQPGKYYKTRSVTSATGGAVSVTTTLTYTI